MRILVVIPCLYGPVHTKEAIDSVSNKENVDLLLIDNGAEPAVTDVILKSKYRWIIKFQENVYVNPAWQQGIKTFLALDEYTHLIIMNSDLIMQSQWAEVCINRWKENPDEILLPVMVNDKNLTARVSTDICEAQLVHEGTPGVFITLSRKQAEIINPLPTELKVWFGDNWIYEILRGCGYKTVIPCNLISFHYWSQNVQRVAGIGEIIEEDKRQWEVVKHRKEAIINRNKLIDLSDLLQPDNDDFSN